VAEPTIVQLNQMLHTSFVSLLNSDAKVTTNTSGPMRANGNSHRQADFAT
jgi:hypothetical protein